MGDLGMTTIKSYYSNVSSHNGRVNICGWASYQCESSVVMQLEFSQHGEESKKPGSRERKRWANLGDAGDLREWH